MGMRVQVWAVNEQEDMERLIGLDVNGIFTDDPVLLESLLER